MPANAAHAYRNAGGEPAHFMAVVDDEAAATLPIPEGPPSPELIGRVMALTRAHGIAVMPPAG
jgi:hypothetical protein